MVSPTLRQNQASALERNAINHPDGTPAWAVRGFRSAPGAPAPRSPWDAWSMPPRQPRPFAPSTRKPSPKPDPLAGFRPWRIGFESEPAASTGLAPSRSHPGDRASQSGHLQNGDPHRLGKLREHAEAQASPSGHLHRPWKRREHADAQVPQSGRLSQSWELHEHADARAPQNGCLHWPLERREHGHTSAPRSDRAALPLVGTANSRSLTKRVMLLFGFAYLLLAALTSGLVWSSFVLPLGDEEPLFRPYARERPRRRLPRWDEKPQSLPPEPSPESAPDPTHEPVSEPTPDPTSPGLHIRPDGSRFLIMRLPSDIADRLRGHARFLAIGGAR